jgi:hypothetical protein
VSSNILWNVQCKHRYTLVERRLFVAGHCRVPRRRISSNPSTNQTPRSPGAQN